MPWTTRAAPTAQGRRSLYEDDEHAFNFSKEIGLNPLPIDSSDASIIRGELVPDTWGDGLNKLPYPPSVREGFKKFKKEMLAIDVEKRGKELYNTRLSDFMKGYPVETQAVVGCLRAVQLWRGERRSSRRGRHS